jgi:hypothetical protein
MTATWSSPLVFVVVIALFTFLLPLSTGIFVALVLLLAWYGPNYDEIDE